MNEISKNWQLLVQRAGAKAGLLGEAWPTKKEEAYHYASLSVLDKKAWQSPDSADKAWVDAEIENLSLPSGGQNRLVFANGFFCPDHSFLQKGGKWEINSCGMEKLQGQSVSFEEKLNVALRQQKIHLSFEPFSEKQTLELIFLTKGGAPISVHPVLHFSVSEGQDFSVLEIHSGAGEFLENSVISTECAKGAKLEWVKTQFSPLESASLSLNKFFLCEEAEVSFVLLGKGSLFTREVVRAELLEEKAVFKANGLQLVFGDEVIDFNLSVWHEANHTASDQVVKSLAGDNGHAIFQGKSAISKRGNKSKAYQKADALLLSEKAVFDVKPELEIFADDVKCSHGATVGSLSDLEIFYLRARGIAYEDAKTLLLFSVPRNIIEKISDQKMRLWTRSYVLPFLQAHHIAPEEPEEGEGDEADVRYIL